MFSQQCAAECAFEDFDGGGVARVDFDQPRDVVGEDEVDAEQAAQLGFASQRVAESLQQFVSPFAHGDGADGAGVAELARCAEHGADELFADADQFDFYLRLQTLDSIARMTGVSEQPSWRAFREHPAYDAYWEGIALPRVLRRAAVPMLFVGGFYDEEDILGAPLGYRSAERADPQRWNRLVLGPWSHNMWIRPGGDSLGALRFGSATADFFRQRIQRPWFAHYLHGRGRADFPEVWAFEGGSNTWRTFGTWLMEDGVEVRVIQELLGHGSPDTTARYIRVHPDLIRTVPSPLDML